MGRWADRPFLNGVCAILMTLFLLILAIGESIKRIFIKGER